MNPRIARCALILLLAALTGSLQAPETRADEAGEERGGEVGFLAGFVSPDEDLAAKSDPSPDLTLGLRGGSAFARRWTWYVDGLYSNIRTGGGLGDARTVAGRTGFDLYLNPDSDLRWFVTFGAGWMTVDFENATFEDFHRPFASIGFGQNIRIVGKKRLRWEIREDLTLDDARLGGQDVLQGHFLIGLIFGPGTRGERPPERPRPPGRAKPSRPAKPPAPSKPTADADGDGIKDRADACRDTPAGAVVDSRGCPQDADHDGVFDGIDRCPATRSGTTIDATGCPRDSDGDGVHDGSDACRDTPEGATVDEWGCPKDSDRDGVLNGIDRCPATPVGARVDATGCPRDSDGDGIYDGIDRCEGTPKQVEVDATGCPADTDGDGVLDGTDACPDTPAGTAVDARGCAKPAPVFERGKQALVLEGVGFELNSAILTRGSIAVLDGVARSLREWPDVRVEIGGHTDASGSAAQNVRLSLRRAEAVRDHLVGRGVAVNRLVVRGYGASRPIDDNRTRAGQAKNRRVELKKIE